MKTGHTTVTTGKRVRVFMRDGNHFFAKFKQHEKQYLEFYDHEPVHQNLVRTITITKGAMGHVAS